MGILMRNKPYGYSKMGREDPEETSHRKAQFLIYKTLERADSMSMVKKRPSWLRVRVSKLKIKIGRRMKRLKKCMFFNMTKGGVSVQKQVVGQLACLKRFLGVREAVGVTLPPLFT